LAIRDEFGKPDTSVTKIKSAASAFYFCDPLFLETRCGTMYSMDNTTDLEFTKKLLMRIGASVKSALLLPYETKWKLDNTPVTDIDILVTSEVAKALAENYPNDTIYGEEEAVRIGESGYTWILDPIDGTQALGMLPTATICLARTCPNGLPLFSVVMNPATDELFYSDGIKSYLNDKQISVSKKDTIKGSYIYLGSRLSNNFATNGIVYDMLEQKGAKIFNVRSLAFSCLMIATGKAEGAYIGVTTPFEAASIKLLVECAGGKVTDLDGNTQSRFDKEINGLIVSNGIDTIHDQLVSAVRK
jgi:fructose-1,6-bisphosphatase/inositol monophosphatase family enzyme